MKKFLWLAWLIALRGCTPGLLPSYAQNVEGQAIASQYGQFQLQGTATNSFVFTPASCQVTAGGNNFAALMQGVPVRVVDPGNHALDETVTAGLVNINACSVQLAVSNTHVPPFYVTSGTAGLQEAINANAAAGPANTIIIDAGFYALGGTTSIITSVVGGSANLGLVDITTTPYTWYAWSGSAYAKVSIGGGGSPGGSLGAIQSYGAGPSFAGTVISGIVKGNGAAAPSAAVAGTDYQTPITNACTGGITCPLTGSTYNFSYSGSAGSGTVGTGSQYQDSTYPNSGSTTAVGALTNRYTVPTGLNSSQLNTFFSGLSNSTATIQNGDGQTPFTNSNFDGVEDLRETHPTKPWDVKESGAQCDLQGGFGSVTQGSPTLTFTSGYSASASDVGKYIEMVYEVSGEPTRFDATVTAVTNSTTVTLSTNAPFTVSEYSVEVGHRDDAAIASAFGHFTYARPIEFPIGNCWSDTIAVYGQSFHGLSSTQSFITGLAGDDVFAALDPSKDGYQAQSPDMQISNMHWEIDPRINASQPWQDVGPTGTVTQHAASYRPVGLMTVWANYPLGPGWMEGPGANNTGATNGVAAITQNSAVICIPTSETEPPVGQTIIFPYFSSVFTSTVSSLKGSGCATGSNPLTMAAALPNTSSYTTTQSEWFAGTSVQTIQTNIPATGRTFPMTVTLANPITPPLTVNVFDTASNVAPYGLVQIDGEQFSYFGDSAYPATNNSTPSITLTAGAQNGTSAAAHSTGATIVPLNPFEPTWPWPVLPSLNSGVMPANASYFPAWDVGNAGWAEPWYDGTSTAAGGGLSYARMHDITIDATLSFISGSGGGVEGGPNAFQQSNATAGMYITRLPFKSKFYNIHITDPQFGIFEGEPSINTYGLWSAYPTANGSSWDNITIQSAGYDTLFIGGQNDSKTNFLTFCENGGETGNSWPGQALGDVGCGAVWIWGGTYDDKEGGGGSDNTTATFDNWYIEAETGSQTGLQPGYEFNCGVCNYTNIQPSGLVTYIEGGNNTYTNSRFNAIGPTPIINYAANTGMQFMEGVSDTYNSNTYGESSFIGYAPNSSISAQANGNTGPFISPTAGNSIATVNGQTGEAFETGNDAAAYISSSSALIYPDQFNASGELEVAPMSVGWTFDDTAPISHSYTACNTNINGIGCNTHVFNGNGGGVRIGAGQQLAPGQYIAHWAMRTTQASDTLNFQLSATNIGLTCTPATVLDQNVPLTSTWTQFTSGILDFSGNSGCGLDVWFNGTTGGADQVQLAYLIFTPVWDSITLPSATPADNATCVPGSFIGSDSSYLYVCTASGAVKRAPLSTY